MGVRGGPRKNIHVRIELKIETKTINMYMRNSKTILKSVIRKFLVLLATIFIDCKAREIMYPVASVHLFVSTLTALMCLPILLPFSSLR